MATEGARKMNEDLLQLIQDFATKEHTEINQSLSGISKEEWLQTIDFFHS